MPCAPIHIQPRKLVEAGPRAASPLLHAHKADGAVGATPEDGGNGLSSGLLMPTCNYSKRSAAILSRANSDPAPLPQHAITFQLGLRLAREAQVTDTASSGRCFRSCRQGEVGSFVSEPICGNLTGVFSTARPGAGAAAVRWTPHATCSAACCFPLQLYVSRVGTRSDRSLDWLDVEKALSSRALICHVCSALLCSLAAVRQHLAAWSAQGVFTFNVEAPAFFCADRDGSFEQLLHQFTIKNSEEVAVPSGNFAFWAVRPILRAR